ncbi:DEAD/DEAH box helicase [candidate division KSB1 bacterium]|nr:DEAD/DEAH box helicase [candidate division KSB1 bacterium]
MAFNPGSMVRTRDRDWIVMPSPDPQVLQLKPLGGSEEELTTIYLPFKFQDDVVLSSQFPMPGPEDIGDLASAQLLFDATRLAFRNAAGPFRSLAKLSFRPRSYQMVPLIMALKQETVRLLIADDVGVGKTIEALLVVKEMLERRTIKRFAIVCPPHLCEQWQLELESKFGIQAVIIRSNTQARLDRDIHGDTSVYQYYPFQIISIDYIKSDLRRQVFIQECPELIVVDEVHTCAQPNGQEKARQQRHDLVNAIARKPNQHLLLLTATPHSGKPEEFRSLLKFLHPDFLAFNGGSADEKQRKKLAVYFIQRRRADVKRWMGEDTPFPERESGEYAYRLSKPYETFFFNVLKFARDLVKDTDGYRGRQRFRYWSALALMRGVMSSPAAGVEMLINRMRRENDDRQETDIKETNPLLEDEYGIESDMTPAAVVNKTEFSSKQNQELNRLKEQLEKLASPDHDYKLAQTIQVIGEWLEDGFHPVIFCRYIATAKYVGEWLKVKLSEKFKRVDIQIVTSEDPDEVRKDRIEGMEESRYRVLVATDCLSEGINLQDLFSAVLHYDLPWNPNKLEQREGRVDRFGQQVPNVRAFLLYGDDNPIDGAVLKVILRKVREIRKSIGVSLPFPEESQTILDAVLHSVLLDANWLQRTLEQTSMDFGETDPILEHQKQATRAYEEAAGREKQSRSIFAQHSIKADEIETDLKDADQAIGSPQAVESFVLRVMNTLLGVQCDAKAQGYTLYPVNLPAVLKETLPDPGKRGTLDITFHSPVPEGFFYIGRNHPFVEQLCQLVTANALEKGGVFHIGRAAVVRSKQVQLKTTIMIFRVRNVIENKKSGDQLIAEEAIIWGYRGTPQQREFLSQQEAADLLKESEASADLSPQARVQFLEEEIERLQHLESERDALALQRAEMLVDAHDRFRKAMGGGAYQIVKPVLPMDVLGLYVLLPG